MESVPAFALACFAGTLVEYGLHRAIHHHRLKWMPPYRTHLKHHQKNEAQPVLVELTDYLALAGLAAPLGLLGSWWFCGGWVAGCVAYALLVALVHHSHHQQGSTFHELHHSQPCCNYGVVVTWWDHAFGTYRR